MANINDFFSFQNTIKNISDAEQAQLTDYLAPIRAFSRTTNKSIYIIDYQKKGFEFVSKNPLFLCGHTADEVKEMGYEFYFKYVIPGDLDLLLKINQIGFDFYDQVPLKDRINYSISYDFHLRNQEDNIILLNQKLTPLFLTADGKIWKAICIVSLSTASDSGNIVVVKDGDNKMFKYNLKDDCWSSSEIVELSKREKEILRLSSRGFTINDISKKLFVSPDTIKFHRKKLFEKLEVSNITEAISFGSNNNLI
ncbi:response regulator transcription factor [Spongiimicrobium salis]|uniref:response regulator transcription factor n=1 Tax=Spongiimicrobium salis TaxID=1667022 RepID=UPI00374DCBDA